MAADADALVVYDGDDVASNRNAFDMGPVRSGVVFTEVGTEADDELLSMIDRSNRPVVLVVSNDRRVQDGARARGANVIPSSAFVELF